MIAHVHIITLRILYMIVQNLIMYLEREKKLHNMWTILPKWVLDTRDDYFKDFFSIYNFQTPTMIFMRRKMWL